MKTLGQQARELALAEGIPVTVALMRVKRARAEAEGREPEPKGRHSVDDEPETPAETERLDRALTETTWDDRQRVEANVAMGDYGTPMDEVVAELAAEDDQYRSGPGED